MCCVGRVFGVSMSDFCPGTSKLPLQGLEQIFEIQVSDSILNDTLYATCSTLADCLCSSVLHWVFGRCIRLGEREGQGQEVTRAWSLSV